MNIEGWVNLIVEVFASLAVILPLGLKLAQTVKDLVKQRNWPKIVNAVIRYMMVAEDNLTDGAEKKEWVLSMIQSTAEQLNYELTESDLANIADMIDDLVDLSDNINVKITE